MQKIVIGSIAFILLADATFFTLWYLSGQHPIDGFYFGAITANILGINL